MKLFDVYERIGTDYKDDNESDYAYMNRTARPKFTAARSLLEQWFAAYPAAHQATLAANFTADTYGPHIGAFFELYCFALFRSQHLDIQIEQVVDQKKGNPIDFVIKPARGHPFCVEATVVADAELTMKSRRALAALKKRLNRISSNRQIRLHIVAVSKQPLPYDEIVTAVEQWLTSAASSQSSLEWRGREWRLRFKVVPGVRANDLVRHELSGGWVRARSERQSRLQLALESKAKQHGGVAMPYVIAVDILGDDAMAGMADSIADDLFGREVLLVDRDTGNVVDIRCSPELPRRSDRENGLWLGRSGPRNRHVSAILLVNEVVPWSVMKQTPVLWHNPWATYPLLMELWLGPHMMFDLTTDTWRYWNGKPITEIFVNPQ